MQRWRGLARVDYAKEVREMMGMGDMMNRCMDAMGSMMGGGMMGGGVMLFVLLLVLLI
jgi:hypothetical protein